MIVNNKYIKDNFMVTNYRYSKYKLTLDYSSNKKFNLVRVVLFDTVRRVSYVELFDFNELNARVKRDTLRVFFYDMIKKYKNL